MEESPKKNVSKGRIIAIVAVAVAIVFAVLCATHVICLSHDWKAATCTEPAVCTKCGRTDGDPLGHTAETDPAVAATCTETGLTEGLHCSVCGEILVPQETVPALGHTPEIDYIVEPTCTESGLTEGSHCSVCGEILTVQETVPALGHTEVTDAAVEPTCTETGLTEGKHCSVCNEVLVPQEVVPALGHTEVTDAAVEPTCTETGLTEGRHCSICNEILVPQEVIPALGHSFSEATYSLPETCTVCGATNGEALGNELFKKLFSPAVPDRALTGKAPFEGTISFKANASGKGMGEVAKVLENSAFISRIDKDARAGAADLTLNGGTPFTFIYDFTGDAIRFALPGVDDNIYKVTPEVLMQAAGEASGSANGKAAGTAGAGFSTQLSSSAKEIAKKLASYSGILGDVINPDTVTDTAGEYTLTALGETVPCRILTCTPSKSDWKNVLSKFFKAIKNDKELKEIVLTLVKPLADAGIIPDITNQYDTTMTMLVFAAGTVADTLEGASMELAYSGDRAYALRVTYNGIGGGFETAGELSTGLRTVFAMYSGTDATILAEHTVTGSESDLTGFFKCESIGLNGDYTASTTPEGVSSFLSKMSVSGTSILIDATVQDTDGNVRFTVALPDGGSFDADVGIKEEAVTIAMPEGTEVILENTEAVNAAMEKITDALYNAHAFGHDWQNADCDTPKTCRICGEIEGDALGHTPGEWTVTRNATATEAGSESLLCAVCGKPIETRALELSMGQQASLALIGSWFSDIDATEKMNAQLIPELLGEEADAETIGALPSISFRFILTFSEDGTFSFAPDAAQFKDALSAYLNVAFPQLMTAVLSTQAKEMGASLEDFYAIFGVTDIHGLLETLELDGLMDELLTEEAVAEQLSSSTLEGNFTVSDNTIIFTVDSEASEPFTLEDNTLTFTGNDTVTGFLAENGEYPIVFTRLG